jgi:divalent metal cation (Fe/Co/Zn/Cd) transporter
MRRGMIEAMRSTKDPTVITVLLEDSAAMAGLVFATLGIALTQILGSPIYDGIGSICVGIMLAAVALFLGRESHSLLTGESAQPEVVDSIRSIAAAGTHVAQVDDVLTIHFGPRDLLVALYLAFDNGAVAEIHPSVVAIKRKIIAAHPEVSRVLVEAREAGKHRHRQSQGQRAERRRPHHRAGR